MNQPGVLSDQTLLIEGNRIARMAPATELEPPAGARIVDGRGRYLIPGLADMHEHLPRGTEPGEYPLDRYFDLQLAAGVTTIRTMRGAAGDPELRDAIRRGDREGPRLIVGSPAFHDSLAPDARTARALVREYSAAGFDFIKILDPLDPATFAAIIEAAEEVDLPLAGHLPDSIS
ncbi:MAG: amidohydrolase family protein, partial [Planctomycetota bacterium]